MSTVFALLHTLVLKIDVTIKRRGLNGTHYVPDVDITLRKYRTTKEGTVHRLEPRVLAVEVLGASGVSVRRTKIEVLHMNSLGKGNHLLYGNLGNIVNAGVVTNVELVSPVVTLYTGENLTYSLGAVSVEAVVLEKYAYAKGLSVVAKLLIGAHDKRKLGLELLHRVLTHRTGKCSRIDVYTPAVIDVYERKVLI